jgi:hypothetical protein
MHPSNTPLLLFKAFTTLPLGGCHSFFNASGCLSLGVEEQASGPHALISDAPPEVRYLRRRLTRTQAESFVYDQLQVQDIEALRAESVKWEFSGQHWQHLPALQEREGQFFLFDSVESDGLGARGVILLRGCQAIGVLWTYVFVDA